MCFFREEITTRFAAEVRRFFLARKNVWCRWVLRAGVTQGACEDGVLKVVISLKRNDRFGKSALFAWTKQVFFEACQI